MNKNCKKMYEFIDDHSIGQLAEKNQEELLTHVQSCADCRAKYEATNELTESLSSLAEDRPQLPAELRKSFVETIEKSIAKNKTPRLGFFERLSKLFISSTIRPLGVLTVATALLIIFAISTGYFDKEQQVAIGETPQTNKEPIWNVSKLTGLGKVINQDEEELPLVAGKSLAFAGDKIELSKGMLTLVKPKGEASVVIKGLADISLPSPNLVFLTYGAIVCSVDGSRLAGFAVSAGECKVFVTGTVFRVSYNGEEVRVGVEEGRVQIKSFKGQVELRAGEKEFVLNRREKTFKAGSSKGKAQGSKSQVERKAGKHGFSGGGQ